MCTEKMANNCRSSSEYGPVGDNVYALDIEGLSSKNRNRLIQTFLPDIEQAHARLGYVYKVTPYNYNLEHFKTVEMRRRPAVYTRPIHDAKVVMRAGHAAANEIEPRPMWAMKPLRLGRSIVNPNEEYTVLTRFYPWRYRKPELKDERLTNARTRAVMSEGGSLVFENSGGRTGLPKLRVVRTS